MMNARAHERITETRDEILDVALKHFQHFGVGKTAMADIASDVNMSTANLYRYFKNKEEIVVACSQRCLTDRHNQLLSIVNHQNNSATQKLKEFFRESLRYTYNQAANNPNITELVKVITSKHHHIVHEKNQAEKTMIEQILKQGQTQQVFNINDIEQTTLGIHSALHLFQFPVAMDVYPLPDLEKKADAVTALIIKALQK